MTLIENAMDNLLNYNLLIDPLELKSTLNVCHYRTQLINSVNIANYSLF